MIEVLQASEPLPKLASRLPRVALAANGISLPIQE